MTTMSDLRSTCSSLPDPKDFKLNSISFAVHYIKDEPGKSFISVGNYEKGQEMAEVLVQRPKDIALSKVDLKKLKSKRLKNEEIFLNYKPEFEFFTQKAPNIFSWVRNENVFSLKGRGDFLKSFVEAKCVDLKTTGFEKFGKYISFEIDGYEAVFFVFNPRSALVEYVSPGLGSITLEMYEERPTFKVVGERKTTKIKNKEVGVWRSDERFYLDHKTKKGIMIFCSCLKENEEKQRPVTEKLLLETLNRMK